MADPAEFQFPANITTDQTQNAPARPDAYTSPGTIRNVQQPSGAVRTTNTPAPTSSTDLGNVRKFYAEDQTDEKDTA